MEETNRDTARTSGIKKLLSHDALGLGTKKQEGFPLLALILMFSFLFLFRFPPLSPLCLLVHLLCVLLGLADLIYLPIPEKGAHDLSPFPTRCAGD
jgi:hypothetical protein